VRPDVSAVLFDEPLTVIDPALKWELRSKLKAVHRALDLLMIYVTHDQVEALTFADRVVVMNDGRVLQIGTPAELFEKPEHIFVGYFIGSPGMNLLPASVQGHQAHIGAHAIDLRFAYPNVPHGSNVRLGIRPDFATVGGTAGLPVQVRRIEDLGRRRLARVSLDGHDLVATLPPGASISGSETLLRMDPANLHVYVDDYRVEGLAA
jgi:glycerol transport system ATP-binding protein